MKLSVQSFRGEFPRTTPRLLPENAAQEATNCRMQTGDLESWRQFLLTKTLANVGVVQTIYLLNGLWLSWNAQVDVARGVIAGDNTFRIYLTSPGLYSTPQWTNYTMATTGAEPFPVATRPLGVPSPSVAPSTVVQVNAADVSNIVITNPGAESGTTTGWTVLTGTMVVHTNGDIVGLNAQAGTRFFGGGSGVSSSSYQVIDLVALGILPGYGMKLAWYQATGAAGSTAGMTIEFYDGGDVLIPSTSVVGAQLAPGSVHTWLRREITGRVPDGAESARLVQQFTRVGAGPAIDAYIDTITINSLAYSNFFDGSTLAGWQVSSNFGTRGSSDVWRAAYVDGGNGWAPPCFRLEGDESIPWFYRDFSTDQSPSVSLEFDFQQIQLLGNGLHVQLFGTVGGLGTSILFSQHGVLQFNHNGWDDYGTQIKVINPGFDPRARSTVTLTTERLSTSESKLTIRVVNVGTGAVVVDNKITRIPIDGPCIGFMARTGGLGEDWFIDNVSIEIAAPTPIDAVATTTATSYVYTFVNDVGEQSAPSPASATVLHPEGISVSVTTPTTTPTVGDAALYGIVKKYIHRAVTGASGTAFVFVGEIPLATAEFLDALTDNEIAANEVLESDEWDLPPADLQGIIALPNGIMAGFVRNQLCLSAAGHPHAWPVRFRYPVDTDIVAIANIDNTIVIGTKSFLYTATGNSPDSYSMSKPGDAQSCTSKRSMVYLPDVGVVYASPDGWMVCAGSAGQVRNATSAIFTKRQWAALDPTSMIAAVHDGILFFFSTGQTPDAGYALDTKADGFGLIRLSFHATAAHADPLTDALYLALDVNSEPTSASLPLASTAVVPNGLRVYQFDAGASDMVYRWRGRLNITPYSLALTIAQVRALTFTNLLARFYGDGVQFHQQVMASGKEFVLPALKGYDTIELELMGTNTVRGIQAAEDVMELS